MGLQVICKQGQSADIVMEVSGAVTPATMSIDVKDNNNPANATTIKDDGGATVSKIQFTIPGTSLPFAAPFDMLVNWRPVSLNPTDTAKLCITVTQVGVAVTTVLDDAGNAVAVNASGRFDARINKPISADDVFGLILVGQ